MRQSGNRAARADFGGPHPAINPFEEYCNAPDPRRFVTALRRLDYCLPAQAKPVIRSVVNGLRGRRGTNTVSVLDVGCSYGINSAVLKYDMDFGDLAGHWGQRRLLDAAPDELREYDRRFFRSLGRGGHVEMIGLDTAPNALDYALATGLLDRGYAEDLDDAPAPPELAARLASVDLVLATGCVRPVSGDALARIVRAAAAGTNAALPWVACFAPRTWAPEAIAEPLAEAGLVSETPAGLSFRQRRFAGAAERTAVMAALARRGLDAADREADGYLYAGFHLSRPAADIEARPLDRLLR